MWTEFEWENRVNVSTTMSYVSFIMLLGGRAHADAPSDPRDYLKHVMKATNMSCLTPEGAISGECDFLSANMYARSLFGKSYLLCGTEASLNLYPLGEDALANLSVERTEAGTIIGHVRIRSKTQGIALSLGDRITMGTCGPRLRMISCG